MDTGALKRHYYSDCWNYNTVHKMLAMFTKKTFPRSTTRQHRVSFLRKMILNFYCACTFYFSRYGTRVSLCILTTPCSMRNTLLHTNDSSLIIFFSLFSLSKTYTRIVGTYDPTQKVWHRFNSDRDKLNTRARVSLENYCTKGQGQERMEN